jgi:hypothetical protein
VLEIGKIHKFFDFPVNLPLIFQDKGLLSFGLWRSSINPWFFLIRQVFGKSRRYEVGCVRVWDVKRRRVDRRGEFIQNARF